jgi:hypothetical protein
MTRVGMKDAPFLKVFREAAMRSLLELGESIRIAILFHMERTAGAKNEEILKDPSRFGRTLERMFGAGAKVIEDKIILEVCKELELDCSRFSAGDFEQRISSVYLALHEKAASGTEALLGEAGQEKKNKLVPQHVAVPVDRRIEYLAL